MDETSFDDWTPRTRFSLRSLLGVHSAAAVVCEFAAEAPVVAGLLGAVAAFILLQMGVLAACTCGLPRVAR
jgi:hypothetical protein